MRVFSIFLTVSLLCGGSMAAAEVDSLPAPVHSLCCVPEAADSCNVMFPAERIPFAIEYHNSRITGMLIIKAEDGVIKGSMVNEFGMSALDFKYEVCSDKMQLISVVGWLDKWYIRRVLRNDLKYCLHQLYGTRWRGRGRYVTTRDTVSGTLSILNTKRGLTYSFMP